jgi:hypothetical protein
MSYFLFDKPLLLLDCFPIIVADYLCKCLLVDVILDIREFLALNVQLFPHISGYCFGGNVIGSFIEEICYVVHWGKVDISFQNSVN